MPVEIALGFRVKSGFAVAVALSGTAAAPVALARRIVALSDPGAEKTRQPYHDGFGTAQEDAKEIARLSRIIERCARGSVDDLLSDGSFAGARCRGAGLVVGSVIDPATIGNLHIRAHASEGRLFRTALEAALNARSVVCSVIVEKTLATEAARALNRPGGQIARIVGSWGAALGGPWRAEEKAAATAAWMLLGKS
jgi:hypothetical protein